MTLKKEIVKPIMISYDHVDHDAFEDILMMLAQTVEKSMIQAGARPHEDYSYRDLYELAQPFALEVFKQRNNAWLKSKEPIS